MVKCPFCEYEGGFKRIKTWKFRFYTVEMLECLRCHGVFNYYYGMSPRSKKISIFVIRVRPRGKVS